MAAALAVRVPSQLSSSLRKRRCACATCSSRKPRTSEPAMPKSEEEKDRPMPASGAARPALSSSKSTPASAPVRSERMTLPTERDRFEQAPEGAEQAEEDQQAAEIAQHLAPVVEPDRDRFQHRGGLLRGEGPAVERRQDGAQRRDDLAALDLGIDRRGRQPRRGAGLAMDAPELAQRDQHADEERAEDQAVQARIGHEGGDQPRPAGCSRGSRSGRGRRPHG